MADPAWLEISVVVDSETAEAVAEVLSRYAENGVVVEQGVDYNDAEDVGTPFGPCRVTGYLPVDETTEEKRQRILEGLWYLGRITAVPEPELSLLKTKIGWQHGKILPSDSDRRKAFDPSRLDAIH